MTVGSRASASAGAGVRFLRELALVIGFGAGVGVVTTFLVYPAFGVTSAAPQPARTLLVLGLLTWIIRKNGESWKDFGLASFRPAWLLPVLAITFLAIQIVVAQPLGDALRDFVAASPSDRSFLSHLQGNVPAFAGWLILAWVVGGFAEEMIFRGYLLNRIGRLLGGTPVAWGAAVFAQASLFGLLHFYLGSGAALVIGFKALFTGAFYVASRRNLWPVILVHGLWDSLGFTLVFVSGSPSM